MFSRSALLLAALLLAVASGPAPTRAQTAEPAAAAPPVAAAAPAGGVIATHVTAAAHSATTTTTTTVAEAGAPINMAMAVSRAVDLVATLDGRVRAVIGHGLAELSHMQSMVRAMAPDSGGDWLGAALLEALVVVALSAAIAQAIGFALKRWWLRRYPAVPTDRTTRVCVLATRGAIGLIQVSAILAAGLLFNDTNNVTGSAEHITVLVAVVATAASFFVLDVFHTLISPDRTAYRMIALDDAEARALWRDTLVALLLVIATISVAAWVRQLPMGADAFLFVYLLQTFVAMAILVAFTVRQRWTIGRAILGAHPHAASAVRRVLAYSWHIGAIAYFLAAWAFASGRALLGSEGFLALLTAPILLLALAFMLYDFALVLIESVFRAEELGTAEDGPGEPMPTFRTLAEEAAAIFVILLAVGALFMAWGVNLFATSETAGVRIFTEVVVVLAAYLAYQATRIAIDRHLARDAMHEDPTAFHGASSRLGTLLHLFRGFALISIVVMAAMVALSDLGFNIAPLFAGAGVIGLAVGFGSQTLIKDIFSGAFFLIDDAFRRGEYIDVGTAKGSVERISVRSLQLRHQNGPLFTIPFGNIHQISNFSRDWVIMKLPIRLAYGTDPEQVRKIIKRISESLVADPEFGPKFLDPLKSQGVYAMDDNGMTFRVKFMTRPGDNFVIRRMIYQRIQEEFDKAGIKFAANRSVTVRVEAAPGLDPGLAKAGAAAAPMLAAPSVSPDDEDDAADER